MTVITLSELISQFEASDLAVRIPVAIKTKIVHELCREYTKDMSEKIRRVVVNSSIISLKRKNLHDYAQAARSLVIVHIMT